MLVSFFRSTKAQVFFVLPIIAIALRIPAFFGFIEPPVSSSILFENSLGWLKNWPIISVLLAASVTLLQAILLNSMVRQFELLRKINYLTAFYFVLFASLLPSFWFLTEDALALLFLLFALQKMVTLARSDRTLSLSFDSAFLISLAACFSVQYTLFFLLLLIAQISFSSMGWREILTSCVGWALPVFFWWSYYYLVGSDNNSVYAHFLTNTVSFQSFDSSFSEHLVFWLSLVVLVVMSLGSYMKGIQVNTVKTKNTLLLFLWLFVVAIFNEWWLEADGVSLALLLAPALIASNYSTYAKKKWIPEVLVLILMASAFYSQWAMFG